MDTAELPTTPSTVGRGPQRPLQTNSAHRWGLPGNAVGSPVPDWGSWVITGRGHPAWPGYAEASKGAKPWAPVPSNSGSWVPLGPTPTSQAWPQPGHIHTLWPQANDTVPRMGTCQLGVGCSLGQRRGSRETALVDMLHLVSRDLPQPGWEGEGPGWCLHHPPTHQPRPCIAGAHAPGLGPAHSPGEGPLFPWKATRPPGPWGSSTTGAVAAVSSCHLCRQGWSPAARPMGAPCELVLGCFLRSPGRGGNKAEL